ncbi:MAG TPA: hypothetical protein VH703_05770 [Solirubrobacterales bacterium]|jgi:hypothetical protein
MKHIKALAAGALAMAALIALPASAAAFGGFEADEYTAALSAVGSAEFAAGGHGGSCGSMSVEASLGGPSSSLSTSSVSCGSGAIEMKGCQFEFHPSTGSTSIGSEGCGPAKFYLAGCGSALLVSAQDDIATTYENFGSGSGAGFYATIEDTDVKYSTTNNLCLGTGEFENLTVQFVLKVTAKNGSKEAIGTSVVSGGNGEVGLSVEGESSGSLSGAEYPVQVVGERYQLGEATGEITLWELPEGKGTFSCETAEFDGGELSAAASAFGLDASYSGCSVNGISFSVDMNSCHYAYSELELAEEDVYAGAADIACDEEGDVIKLYKTGCRIEIPAQSLNEQAVFLNSYYSFPGWVEVAAVMTGTEVAYTVAGIGCGLVGLKTGSGEDASVHSDMLLWGLDPS